MWVSLPVLFVPVAWIHANLGSDLLDWMASSDGWAGYGAMLAAFLLGTVGLPLPEEAILLTGGYLAHHGALSVVGVYVLGYVVIFLLDVMLYEVGRRAGSGLEQSRWGRRLDPARLEKARAWFDRRGVHTVVLSRFVMGTRTPTFLLAGALGMPRRPFLWAVALSGIVTVAIPVVLGYVFAEHVDRMIQAIGAIEAPVAWAALATVLLLVFWIVRSRRRRDPEEA